MMNRSDSLFDTREMRKHLLIECSDDYLGLWSIIWLIRRKLKNANSDQVRRETLGIIRTLLDDGLIQAGFPTPAGGFEPWSLSPAETIRRIELEWDLLGREPNIGDIAWFTAADKGQEKFQL